jgi:hypothetical protein
MDYDDDDIDKKAATMTMIRKAGQQHRGKPALYGRQAIDV